MKFSIFAVKQLNMPITTVTPEDIHELNQLINSAYRGEESKKGWTTEENLLGGIRISESMLLDYINSPNITLLKYTDDGTQKIIGTVYLEVTAAELYLGMLSVSPVLQAKGVGRALLEAAEVYAKKHHCGAIKITVIRVRQSLIAWYERRGYQFTGTIVPFPDDEKFGIPKEPLEFIEMKKDLST